MRAWTLSLAVLAIAALASPAPAHAVQGTAAQRPAPAPAAPPTTPFQHAQHRNVACANCHNSERRHGELMVRSREDCMRCHHTGAQRQTCSQCHNRSTMRRLPPRPRTFVLAASHAPATLTIRFDHQPHAALECSMCHGAAPSYTPDQVNCATCHALHHGPDATCTTCHGPGAMAKHTREAHVTCASANCHGAAAADLPDSREACVVCHTTQRSHNPGRLCTTCHPVRGTSQ